MLENEPRNAVPETIKTKLTDYYTVQDQPGFLDENTSYDVAVLNIKAEPGLNSKHGHAYRVELETKEMHSEFPIDYSADANGPVCCGPFMCIRTHDVIAYVNDKTGKIKTEPSPEQIQQAVQYEANRYYAWEVSVEDMVDLKDAPPHDKMTAYPSVSLFERHDANSGLYRVYEATVTYRLNFEGVPGLADDAPYIMTKTCKELVYFNRKMSNEGLEFGGVILPQIHHTKRLNDGPSINTATKKPNDLSGPEL